MKESALLVDEVNIVDVADDRRAAAASGAVNHHFVKRAACPVCNSFRHKNLCRIPYTSLPIRDYLIEYYRPVGPGVEFEFLQGSEYALDECADCGLIYQSEIPGPALMKRLYECWLDPATLQQSERRERGVPHYFWASHQLAGALAFLERPTAELNFLDFGMGWGSWCLLAKGYGCNVYGAELSDARQEYANQSGITVLSADRLPEAHFDVINAEQVFEHLAEPCAILEKLRRALKPGGIIRIGVPMAADIKKRLSIWDWAAADGTPTSLNAVAPLQHINCFSGESLRVLAAKVGMREVDVPSYYSLASNAKDAVRILLRPIYRRLLPQVSAARRRRTGALYFQPA